MTHLHQSLAQGRWFTMTVSNQLANVGSEWHRARSAKLSSNKKRFENALDRMLELLNLTLKDPRWTGRRKREIARLKETILESFFAPSFKPEETQDLEKYFYYFGLARNV